MKTVLGIDTSTLRTSVAVVRGAPDDFEVLAADDSRVRSHSHTLLEIVDRVLAGAGLGLGEVDGLAIGAGPGSFTGLRIGMATAKGLAFACEKPLWAVSSLAALALAADERISPNDETLILPVLDARRSEVFVGFYRLRGGAVEAVADERVLAPADLGAAVAAVVAESGCGDVIGIGDGFSIYPDQLAEALAARGHIASAEATPSGSCVARLVLGGEHGDILLSGAPTYIRLSEAEIKFPKGNPGGTFSARRK